MASLEEKYIEYQKDAPPEGALSFKEFENAMSTITKKEDVKEEVVDTSEELPETDQFSEEQFMVGDDSKGMFSMEPELGDAFEVMTGTTFEQDDNRNARLADLVPELKKENEALKIKLTNNLPDPEKEKEKKKKTKKKNNKKKKTKKKTKQKTTTTTIGCKKCNFDTTT